jgi:hypothetical protein
MQDLHSTLETTLEPTSGLNNLSSNSQPLLKSDDKFADEFRQLRHL